MPLFPSNPPHHRPLFPHYSPIVPPLLAITPRSFPSIPHYSPIIPHCSRLFPLYTPHYSPTIVYFWVHACARLLRRAYSTCCQGAWMSRDWGGGEGGGFQKPLEVGNRLVM